MAIFEREDTYLSLLCQRDYTVAELAALLYISEPTVRRDVQALKKKELVSCQRGTVKLRVRYADQRIPLSVRTTEASAAKERIAAQAATHIKNNQVIFLDASTTAYHLLPHIQKRRGILLITNGAKTALDAAAMGIKTICTGGEMTLESFSFVGADAESTLRRYNADVAFFSCRGITNDGYITDNSVLENVIRRIMIDSARESYVLCDTSKRGKTYLNTLCHVDALSGLIAEVDDFFAETAR